MGRSTPALHYSSTPLFSTGRNFGSVTSAVTSSKTTRTGMPTRTSCVGHPITLLIIVICPSVPSSVICATTYGTSSWNAANGHVMHDHE